MKINKVADEHVIPSWEFDIKLDDLPLLREEDTDRLSNLPLSLSEDSLVEQRDIIEKCASNGGYYFYHSEWNDKDVSSLKEYAMVCGMDLSRFKAASPVDVDDIKVLSSRIEDSRMVKEAGKENVLQLDDPFHLDEISDQRETDHNKEDWEVVEGQRILSDRPMSEAGVIRPLRGGEDYNANSFSQTARGQNSIDIPDAIGSYINDEAEDNGARLHRENQERLAQREKNHKAWEQDKVGAMENLDIIPTGKVFPTESMNAQSGLNTSAAKLANIKAEDIPEKTEGELIASRNEERRKSIQRERFEDDWQVMKSASIRNISDDFSESLRRHLGK